MPKKHANQLDLDFIDVVQTGHSALRDAIDSQVQSLREEMCTRHAELAMAQYVTRDMLETKLNAIGKQLELLPARLHAHIGEMIAALVRNAQATERVSQPTGAPSWDAPTGGGDLDDEIPF